MTVIINDFELVIDKDQATGVPREGDEPGVGPAPEPATILSALDIADVQQHYALRLARLLSH